MNDKIESIMYKNYAINVYQDDNGGSPDEWGDDSLFLVHFHRDFEISRDKIITKDDCVSWFNDEKIAQEKEYHIFLTKAYIHSGVVLALDKGVRQFPDERWDVSRCGCVLVSKKEAKTRKQAEKLAEGLIKEWNMVLAGEIYGYMIEHDGDEFGGCWGFYGDYTESGLLDNAKSEIDSDIKEKIAEKNKKLKAYIKNAVSINKRQLLAI
jgi:hypothetical protein